MTPIEAVHTFARHYCMERLTAIKQGRDSAKAEGTERDAIYDSRRALVDAVFVESEKSELLMTKLRERWDITGKWWLPFEKVFGCSPISRLHGPTGRRIGG